MYMAMDQLLDLFYIICWDSSDKEGYWMKPVHSRALLESLNPVYNIRI